MVISRDFVHIETVRGDENSTATRFLGKTGYPHDVNSTFQVMTTENYDRILIVLRDPYLDRQELIRDGQSVAISPSVYGNIVQYVLFDRAHYESKIQEMFDNLSTSSNNVVAGELEAIEMFPQCTIKHLLKGPSASAPNSYYLTLFDPRWYTLDNPDAPSWVDPTGNALSTNNTNAYTNNVYSRAPIYYHRTDTNDPTVFSSEHIKSYDMSIYVTRVKQNQSGFATGCLNRIPNLVSDRMSYGVSGTDLETGPRFRDHDLYRSKLSGINPTITINLGRTFNWNEIIAFEAWTPMLSLFNFSPGNTFSSSLLPSPSTDKGNMNRTDYLSSRGASIRFLNNDTEVYKTTIDDAPLPNNLLATGFTYGSGLEDSYGGHIDQLSYPCTVVYMGQYDNAFDIISDKISIFAGPLDGSSTADPYSQDHRFHYYTNSSFFGTYNSLSYNLINGNSHSLQFLKYIRTHQTVNRRGWMDSTYTSKSDDYYVYHTYPRITSRIQNRWDSGTSSTFFRVFVGDHMANQSGSRFTWEYSDVLWENIKSLSTQGNDTFRHNVPLYYYKYNAATSTWTDEGVKSISIWKYFANQADVNGTPDHDTLGALWTGNGTVRAPGDWTDGSILSINQINDIPVSPAKWNNLIFSPTHFAYRDIIAQARINFKIIPLVQDITPLSSYGFDLGDNKIWLVKSNAFGKYTGYANKYYLYNIIISPHKPSSDNLYEQNSFFGENFIESAISNNIPITDFYKLNKLPPIYNPYYNSTYNSKIYVRNSSDKVYTDLQDYSEPYYINLNGIRVLENTPRSFFYKHDPHSLIQNKDHPVVGKTFYNTTNLPSVRVSVNIKTSNNTYDVLKTPKYKLNILLKVYHYDGVYKY